MSAADELVRLAEAGNWYKLMILATRLWLKESHPRVEFAVVVAEAGKGLPAVQVPITRDAASAPLKNPRLHLVS